MQQLSRALGVLAALAFAVGPAQANYDCREARDGASKWDFGALDRKYTLAWYRDIDKGKVAKTTYDINVCEFMKDIHKECPSHSHICGIEDHMDDKGEHVESAVRAFPIAVDDFMRSKHRMNPEWTRLRGSDSASDAQKHGVRLKLHGEPDKEDKTPQLAIVEFICKPKEEKRDFERRKDEDDDEKDKDGDGDGDGGEDEDDEKKQRDFDKKHPDWAKERSISDDNGGNITFVSHQFEQTEKGAMVLRLEWHTVHACEGSAEDPDLHSSSGWGFFSWLFFLSFMGIIAYFAFFAWINYTRYGKSGFDMLPHSDTLRELPQLLGEYAGKVINTLRGGRSSGGYSAL